MKKMLKFNLVLAFLTLSHTLSFAQGTCGEIVPFASEPVVDGCCVTYEMDLSIGVNWILYPGNGLPQDSSKTSFSNGSNVVVFCYDPPTQGVIYPNISYYDENWNIICSSFYPITLDCELTPLQCGLFSEIEVDSCCITYIFYTEYETIIRYYDTKGDPAGGSSFNPIPGDPLDTLTRCEDEPGDYSFTLECIDSLGNTVSITEYTYTIEDCTTETSLSCGLFSEIEVDSCCITYIFYTEYETIIRYYDTKGDPAGGSTINPFPGDPLDTLTRCEDEPGDYSFTLECIDSLGNTVSITEYTYTIEDCTTETPLPCGLASQIFICGCDIGFFIYSSAYDTDINYYDSNGNRVGGDFQLHTPFNDSSLITFSDFTVSGEYTIILDCLDAQGEIVNTVTETFTLNNCPPRPFACGFASALEVDSCCVRFEIYTGYSSGSAIFFEDQFGFSEGVYILGSPCNVPPTVQIEWCHFEKPGDYTAILRCRDSNGVVVSEVDSTFTIIDCDKGSRSGTNIFDKNKTGDPTIYPNPAQDKLSIAFQEQTIHNIKLFDINNRLLLDKKLNGENIYELDLSQVQSSGIHFLHIITDEGFHNEKVIIQK